MHATHHRLRHVTCSSSSSGPRSSRGTAHRPHLGRHHGTDGNPATQHHASPTTSTCSRGRGLLSCYATSSSSSSSSSSSRQWGKSWLPAKKKQRPATDNQPPPQPQQQQQQQAPSQGRKSGPVSNVVMVEPLDLDGDASPTAPPTAAAAAAAGGTSTAAATATAAAAGTGAPTVAAKLGAAAARLQSAADGSGAAAAAAGPQSAAVAGEWSSPRAKGEVAEAIRLTNLVAQKLASVPALPGCLPLSLLLYDVCIARGLPATLRQGYLSSKVRPEAAKAWPKELATHRYHWHVWVEVSGEVLDLKNAMKLLAGPDSGPVQFMRALEWSYEPTPPPGALCIDTDAEDPKIRAQLRKDYVGNLAMWQEVEGWVEPGQAVPEAFWQRAVPLKAARDALLQGLR